MVAKVFLDAEPVKENWSVYKVSDGTIIKVRYILIKTRKSEKLDDYGNPVYDVNMKDVIGVIPSPSNIGTPSPPFDKKELANSIVEEDMSFKLIKQPWNEYKLEDGAVVKVMAVLTLVSRTSKYDENGEPVYLINYQPMIKGLPSKRTEKV